MTQMHFQIKCYRLSSINKNCYSTIYGKNLDSEGFILFSKEFIYMVSAQ